MDDKGRIVKPTKNDLELMDKLNPRLREAGLELVAPRTMRRIGLGRSGISERQLSLEDIEPKDSDFLLVTARATSKNLIDNGWLVMDFTKKGVLESSVPFYMPKGRKKIPVFTQHNWGVDSVIGWIEDAFFSVRDEGIDFAGVNTVLRIDAGLVPELVRGILGGTVTAVSVTDEWDFDLSHDDLGDDFWDMMGREVDGEIVRLIVIKYKRVFEESFVGLGADNDARVLNARWAGKRPVDMDLYAPEDRGDEEGERKMVIVPGGASRSLTGVNSEDDAKEKEDAMGINSKAIGDILGESVADDESALDKIRQLKNAKALAVKERDEASAKAKELEPLIEAGRERVESLREAVKKAIGLIFKGREEKIPESLTKRIAEADFIVLKELAAMYEAQLESELKFPEKLGERSSVATPLKEGDEGEKPETRSSLKDAVTRVHP